MVCAPSQTSVHDRPRAEDWVLEFPLHDVLNGEFDRQGFSSHGACLGFFHGLLHDREALAAEVGDFENDVQLVLAAYARDGDSLLPRLRGSFALAIIDRHRDLALVARDPLGLHPLFYATRGRSVLFASTPQTLVKLKGVSGDLNRAALADRLCLRWPDPGETYVSAVRRVPPGSCARVGQGAVSVARYWDPLPTEEPVRWSSEEDALRFGAVLNRAVDRCLRAGPAGIFLSGGLDSISVAAVAADRTRTANRPVPLALSLGFPDPSCDERHVQMSVARELGLPQDLVDFDDAVGPRGLLTEALDLNDDLASPVVNSWGPAYLKLAQRGRSTHGVNTILTGSGGDEWLGVSPYLAADLMRKRDVRGLARLLAAWRRSYRHPTGRFLRSAFWTFGLRPLAGMALQRLAPAMHAASRSRRLTGHDPSWVAPDPAIRAEQRRRAPAALGGANPSQGFYLREVRTGLDHALTSQELEEQYQFGQRTGVTFQHPYWDADLVDMLYRLPPDVLNAGGRSKGLVRDTLTRRFPTLGFEHQRKVAATSFYRALVLREGPAALAAMGEFSTLGSLGVVDAKAAIEYARRSLAHSSGTLYQVWDLLNLEQWARSQLALVRG